MSELLTLPCGCVADVDHERGDRLVHCKCGDAWCVTAETATTVIYTTRRITVPIPEVH